MHSGANAKAPIHQATSALEREVIEAIRANRNEKKGLLRRRIAIDPAKLMHHLILSSHGHVQLRFTPIAHELGVEMRTLQRLFRERFQMTMRTCQIEARLSFAKLMLGETPPVKTSVIAAMLGYSAAGDFIRFFERHINRTPSAWRYEMCGKDRGRKIMEDIPYALEGVDPSTHDPDSRILSSG